MWKNLTDLHTFRINLTGSCKPSPTAQHLEESIPRSIETNDFDYVQHADLHAIYCFSLQYIHVTVTANAKWFQHLKIGHFPNQSRLRNTTEPQNRNISEIRHVEILRGGSYGSWLMFSCLQIWISKLLLSFTVFTPEDACEYITFLKALNLSPCHYGYFLTYKPNLRSPRKP